MLAHTAFSFTRAGLLQDIAFVGFAVFMVGFFVWVAMLARRK